MSSVTIDIYLPIFFLPIQKKTQIDDHIFSGIMYIIERWEARSMKP